MLEHHKEHPPPPLSASIAPPPLRLPLNAALYSQPPRLLRRGPSRGRSTVTARGSGCDGSGRCGGGVAPEKSNFGACGSRGSRSCEAKEVSKRLGAHPYNLH
ncbi:uncharacterized protein LOC122299389 [Carya illinoinensis]|uniref:uncharacterized protein LOC122299389 n=1 Tax=Carya illinoinensis TaxID=32201 RepID=UPI001C71DF8F|nr:uncharacterized protein LOC122299389 [Carya illinoinensis]